ncbi:short-chain dehydrogenase/reductase SDR [Rubellimicrobium mesophilum DSM 19309]|uniref:Short-chain dehydrogenase/reductase SDR n=1 Tax=Rubellimicrobium mesophilum DSM 19309 TaxID=442562 RepID=A0A017HV51_9RHOB|nr:SDR family NAD(P)-dependent oxidoreductase [Rubellimicrobium mesophilum]EYD78271.1 short-chain dehydrogenase/reductase SDR [Rubellimicrobium mesophilum DSM 19309]
MPDRKLAVVTGASSGIGRELARCAAEDGCDLVICANEAAIEEAARDVRQLGGQVDVVQADLSTEEGVLTLWHQVGAREVDYLMANAGLTLGHAFADQEWPRIRELIGLNVLGTTLLLHRVLPRMQARGEGRVLVTGSIAGFIPGSYQAVYNATKAYLDSLAFALNDEMRERGVTVTCLMPGPVDTEIFRRGDMEDSPMGETSLKDTPEHTARLGYEAMKAGRAGMTPGLMNKLVTTFAGVLPEPVLARMNRWVSETERDEKAG